MTGAARGIGFACARRLVAEGMRVALVDVDEAALALAADGIGQRAAAFPADLRDVGAIPELLAVIGAWTGPLDGLVHAAGVSRSGPPSSVDEAEWDQLVDVNLKATFFLCRAVAEDMAGRDGGAIVTVASISGRRAAPHLSHYSASKAGVISLTQSFAQVFGGSGVRINSVCPGIVWTPMLEASLERQARERPDGGASAQAIFASLVESETALQRPTEPEDVAAVTAFLLSDDAAAVTGQSINVDSGIQFD